MAPASNKRASPEFVWMQVVSNVRQGFLTAMQSLSGHGDGGWGGQAARELRGLIERTSSRHAQARLDGMDAAFPTDLFEAE
jgi:hypothetical protein